MEPYYTSHPAATFVAALMFGYCCYWAGRALRRWADMPEPEEKDWHPSRHYRGGYGGDYGRGK